MGKITRVTTTARTRRRGPPLATQKYVKRLIRHGKEKNMFEVNSTNYNAVNDGSPSALSDIPQGDGVGQRVGDTVQPYRLRLVGAFHGDTDDINFVRIVVFRWNQDDSPANSDIYENTSGDNLHWGPLKFDNIRGYNKKVDVLYDRVTLVGKQQTNFTSSAAEDFGLHAYKNLRIIIGPKRLKRLIRFSDSTTTGVGKIYVSVVSNHTTASGNYAVIKFNSSLEYFDR